MKRTQILYSLLTGIFCAAMTLSGVQGKPAATGCDCASNICKTRGARLWAGELTQVRKVYIQGSIFWSGVRLIS